MCAISPQAFVRFPGEVDSYDTRWKKRAEEEHLRAAKKERMWKPIMFEANRPKIHF